MTYPSTPTPDLPEDDKLFTLIYLQNMADQDGLIEMEKWADSVGGVFHVAEDSTRIFRPYHEKISVWVSFSTEELMLLYKLKYGFMCVKSSKSWNHL